MYCVTLNSETLKTLICPLNHLVYKHTYYQNFKFNCLYWTTKRFPSKFLLDKCMDGIRSLFDVLLFNEQEKWVYAENFLLKQTNSLRNPVQQLHITHFYVFVVLRGHKDFTRNLWRDFHTKAPKINTALLSQFQF